jgi:voltage-gated potassium channel
MIMGYGIIAVPTGIVSAEYTRNSNRGPTVDDPNYVHVNSQCCRGCGAIKHRDDAKFCHKCGTDLHVEDINSNK